MVTAPGADGKNVLHVMVSSFVSCPEPSGIANGTLETLVSASPISGTGTNPRPASAVGATSACVRAKVIVPTPVAAVIDTPVIALFVTLKEPPATEVPVMVMSPEVVGIFPSRTSTVTVATLLVRATCVICSSVVGPVAFDPKAYPGTPGRSNSGGGATGDAL